MDTRTKLHKVVEKVSAKLASTQKQINNILAEETATLATLKAVGFAEAGRLVLALHESGLATRRDVLESSLVKLSASLAALTPAMTPEDAKDKIQELIASCARYDEFVCFTPEEVATTLLGSSAQMDVTAWQEYRFKFDAQGGGLVSFSLSDFAKSVLSAKKRMLPETVVAVKARVAKEKADYAAKRDQELRTIPTPEEYSAQRGERLAEQQATWTPEQWADYNEKARKASEARQAEQQRLHPREGRTNDGLRPVQEGGVSASEPAWELREA